MIRILNPRANVLAPIDPWEKCQCAANMISAILITDIEEIPESIRYCKNLRTADFSSNPIAR